MGYLCANFILPRPLCSRLSPDVRERQTSVRQTDVRQHHRLIPRLLGAGHNKVLLTAKHRLGRSLFSLQNIFGPRTAKSQPIWIKFCTHLLLYGIHLWADSEKNTIKLDRDWRVGGSRPNQNDYAFCNNCNAPQVLSI